MIAGKHSFKRAAGVLLPVSSLPSPYGIGNFGKDARHWVDFLRNAGQTYWQTLPLSPTGEGDSPYQSFSAFAGNQFFIDFDTLREEGLLRREEYEELNWGNSDKLVDYKMVYMHREPVLRKAFSRFQDIASLDSFIRRNPWFEQYGLYMAIKAAQGLRGWLEWDEQLRNKNEDAINKAKVEFDEDIQFHAFTQYQFDRQWSALRAYANANGVRIIGDIPIYVSLDSADIWGNRNLFQLDKNHVPTEVSGCPPDYFSKEGQLWGNPLYDWEAMSESGYGWWISRLRKSFDLFDVMRIDHFRGLESYYAIPYGDATAENGRWKPGPGREFVDIIENSVKDAKIIAEDLGFHTDGVRELLNYSGYPGMKIVQYAFGNDATDDNIPYKYTADTVVYTGTHDNDTVKGWSHGASRASIRQVLEYMGTRRKRDIPDGMIRLALQSGSNLAIIPIQDWLGLGSGARMNTPSTVGGQNWRWRMSRGALSSRLSEKIARMTQIYGRHSTPEAVNRRLESQ
ncbi:MAG: 4-alpha-glucanotransferase [Oscillospiraceae bacterium]|nr:4-alpha-glucanotransferase [Oscillospiraceae bacterium]